MDEFNWQRMVDPLEDSDEAQSRRAIYATQMDILSKTATYVDDRIQHDHLALPLWEQWEGYAKYFWFV